MSDCRNNFWPGFSHKIGQLHSADGICCSLGHGSYVGKSLGEVLFSGGDFLDREEQFFRLSSSPPVIDPSESPSASPAVLPTAPPTPSSTRDCTDNAHFEWKGTETNTTKTCDWLSQKTDREIEKICKKPVIGFHTNRKIREECKRTCQHCESSDSDLL